ncbi:MAG: helix-turn-helix transcriptional regulator [Nanoarchaeota archaeon]|nr:helix-turn-helix transcriptional regulator [Nanoarchaeota archaeon]
MRPYFDRIAIYSAFSHVARLRIVKHLLNEGPTTFKTLDDLVDFNSNMTAVHLGVLDQAEIIRKKEGKYVVTHYGACAFERIVGINQTGKKDESESRMI